MSDPSQPNAAPPPTESTLSPAWLILLALGAALCGWVVIGPRFFATSSSTVPPNTHLAHLELTPLTPASPPLALDDLRGRVALVNFWGTWCPPCREEFPHLARIEKQYRGRADFRFVSVSLGYGRPQDLDEVQASTQAFLQRGGYDLPVYADAEGRTLDALSPSIDTGGVPITLLVDRDGTITDAWIGFTTSAVDEMGLRLATLLGGK
jgi:thiol-disulfide isomerase/thioredoxin